MMKVREAIPASEEDDLPTALIAAQWAFYYHAEVKQVEKSAKVSLNPFFIGPSGESQPPTVTAVSAEIVTAWSDLAGMVRSPFARARLHHLLFERKAAEAHRHARVAAENYLLAAEKCENGHAKSENYSVGLRLARAVKSNDIADSIISSMTDYARAEMLQGSERPGAVLSMIRPMMLEKQPPEIVSNLLDLAFDAYDDVHIRDQLLTLRLKMTNKGDERRSIAELAVSIWNEAASEATGLVKAAHLQSALQWATKYGSPELVEQAASMLQSIRDEDMGLATFSATSHVSKEQIDEFLEPIGKLPGWREVLDYLPHIYGPPTGIIENTRKQVREHAASFVFRSLMNNVLIGGDNLPRYTAQNDEQKNEMALAEQESFTLQATSGLLAMALSKVADVHGIPLEEDLAAHFSHSALADETLAASLARAFMRYWMNDMEGSAFTAAPRIEALVRNFVLGLNYGVYKLQRDAKPGQYPGLAVLLAALREKGLDESWYRSLLTVCANPAGGWNIRNEIAHGFVGYCDARHAATLLYLALYLLSFRSGEDAVPVDREEEVPAEAADGDATS